jgi:hypothetical protein
MPALPADENFNTGIVRSVLRANPDSPTSGYRT